MSIARSDTEINCLPGRERATFTCANYGIAIECARGFQKTGWSEAGSWTGKRPVCPGVVGMEKILLVEDDESFAKYVCVLLGKERYRVVVAGNAKDAFFAATDSPPDLILLDVVLKGGDDGITLCRRLKGDPRTARIPVLMMSGTKLAEDDQLTGLDQGADDYLLKPVSSKLLVGKVRAVLRRYAAPGELRDLLTAEDLTLDVSSWTVTVKGRAITLTRKEFDLLLMFLRKRGQMLSPASLLETVWGYDPATYTDTRTVKVHIASLRAKLGPKVGDKIVNVPGVGYRFEG
jgi:DNA-binding response OmpR family regulator